MTAMRKSKRITAFVLAAVLACGPTMEAGAAADTPVCDETLYITMDPYGEIKREQCRKELHHEWKQPDCRLRHVQQNYQYDRSRRTGDGLGGEAYF